MNNMENNLYKLIKYYEKKGDFTHTKIEDTYISKIESHLNIKLPSEYIDFLKSFGHGGLDGIETLGIGKNGVAVFEKETEIYRNYGLPIYFIVIENCDEWIYCLNCNNCQVGVWSVKSGYEKLFDNFNEYLSDRVNDAIENM